MSRSPGTVDVGQSFHAFLDLYHEVTYHIVPGPKSGCYFIPFLLLPIALLIPPHVLSHRQLRFSILPLIYACQIHSWYIVGVDVISVNLGLWSLVLLALRDPRKTHRRVLARTKPVTGEKNSEGDQVTLEVPYPKELKKRFSWVLTLLVSIRLTGWKIGEPSHDKTQPPRGMSRLAFLRIAVSSIVYSYLILDATSCYVRIDPYFHQSGVNVDDPYPSPSKDMPVLLVLLRLLPPRVLRSVVLAGQIYALVPGMFYLPVLPAIGLNYIGILPDDWSPHTWTRMFGDFSIIGERGLRGLWSSWWHGMNKQITSTPGRSLAKLFGIPSKSIWRYALITISAFFFSGVLHMGMIPPEPRSTVLSALQMRLRVGAFFWAQIPEFGVEEVVSKAIALWAPEAPHWRASKLVVLAWTAGWLCLTLPILTPPFREIGYWSYHAVPVSLLRRFAGKAWIMW